MLTFRPGETKAYFHRLTSFRLYPYDQGAGFWDPAWCLAYGTLVVPLLALAAGGFLLCSWRYRPIALFCLVAILWQVFQVAAGGVYLRRYAAPLEPLYLLLIWLGAGRLRQLL